MCIRDSPYALNFDSASSDYIDFGAGINISGDASFSFWLYRESTAPSMKVELLQ